MAEREGTGSFDRKRAVSLLQEATRLIAEFSGESQNVANVVPQSLSDTQTLNVTIQNIPSTSSGMNALNRETLDRTLGNFRNLFAPYGSINRRSTSSSAQTAYPSSKRRKPNENGRFNLKRETWTHVFFCLANREQCVPPTASLKTKLQQGGLGRKKVCFHWQAGAIDFEARLEEVYPKLK